MKKINLTKFKKALSILCAVSLLAVSISVVFSVIAVEGSTTTDDDGRTVYDFEKGAWSEENTDGFRTDGTFTEGGDTLYYAINNWAIGKEMCEIIDTVGADGTDSKVLKVYNNRDDGARNYPVITLNDGDRPYKLEKDKQYTVSFKYKVVNGGNTSTSWMTLAKGVAVHSNSQVKMNAPVSAFDDNATPIDKANFKVISFTGSSVKQASGTIGVASPTQDVTMNEWHTFTATFKGGEWSNVHPYLAIYLDIQPGAEIYFDDFVIDTKSTVTFNANGGKISGKDSVELTGEIGAPLTIANPVKDGVEFLGWYTDQECTIPFDSTKFPAKDVTVYAKYSDMLVKYYDFEDGKTKTSGTLTVGDSTVRLTSYDTPTDSSTNHNVWSVYNDSGNNVLRIKDTGKNTTDGGQYQPAVFLLNDGVKPYSLTPGKTYTITMRYKLMNVADINNGWLYVTQSPTEGSKGVWGELIAEYNALDGSAHSAAKNRILSSFNSGSLSTLKDLNGNSVTKGEWNTFSYTFTAQDKGKGNYIGFATCTIPSFEIYIDDVVLLEESDTYKAILFDSNGGPSVAPIAGKDTTATVLPELQNDSFVFEGWYTDKEKTAKFDKETYSELTNKVTTVYANWVVKYGSVFDFEKESTVVAGEVDGTKISSYAPDSADAFKNIYKITTEENGNKVLEIKHPVGDGWDDEASGANKHYKNGCFILNKNGVIPELVPGNQYTVSMRVKVNSYNIIATARVALTEAFNTKYNANYSEFGNIYGASSAFCDEFTDGSRSNDQYSLIRKIGTNNVSEDINGNTIPLGQWVTVTKTFTAYPDKDATGNLYVGFTSCTGRNLSIYIDDICFYDNSTNHALSFNTNGISSVANKYPAVGEKIELPTPTYKNYEFAGWYTDKAFENKAPNPYVMGESDTILYAKWIWKKVTVDFEGGYTDNQTNVSGASSFGGKFYLNKLNANNHGTVMDESTYNAAGCYNDSTSSLLIKINDGGNSSALLRSNLYPNGLTAQNGERFTVTFKYKVEGTLAANTNLKVGYTIKNNNGWYEVKNETSSVAELKNGDGWQTATITYAFDESTYTNLSNGTTYLDPTKPQYIHLQIMPTAPAGEVKVYIDDITVTKVDLRNLVSLKKGVSSDDYDVDSQTMRKLLLGNVN